MESIEVSVSVRVVSKLLGYGLIDVDSLFLMRVSLLFMDL